MTPMKMQHIVIEIVGFIDPFPFLSPGLGPASGVTEEGEVSPVVVSVALGGDSDPSGIFRVGNISSIAHADGLVEYPRIWSAVRGGAFASSAFRVLTNPGEMFERSVTERRRTNGLTGSEEVVFAEDVLPKSYLYKNSSRMISDVG